MSDLVRAALEQLARRGGNGFEREVTRQLTHMEASLESLKEAMADQKLDREKSNV